MGANGAKERPSKFKSARPTCLISKLLINSLSAEIVPIPNMAWNQVSSVFGGAFERGQASAVAINFRK